MSGPTSPRAAVPIGGFIDTPPLTREEAEAYVGAIPEQAWDHICRAFHRFGFGKLDHTASTANSDKNDDNSWFKQRAATEKELTKARELLQRVSRRRRFLHEVRRAQPISGEGRDFVKCIDEALALLSGASATLRYTQPLKLPIKSEEELRKNLVRQLHAIFSEVGLPSKYSDGRTLEQNPEVLLSHLTPFEQLIFALGVYTDKASASKNYTSFARWLRGAIAD